MYHNTMSHLAWRLCLVILVIIEFECVHSQFIPTDSDLQVNRPLQRWEQFQKQLKLNQINQPPPLTSNGYAPNSFISPNPFAPASTFGGPLPTLNNNNLDSLFTINPIANGAGGVNTIDLLSNNKPSVVLNTLPNSAVAGGDGEPPNRIFISDSSNRFRDLNDNRYVSTSNSPSSPANRYTGTSGDQDPVRFTTNTAFLDSIRNRTHANDSQSTPQAGLNSSYSNSIHTKTNIDNFKELNANLTRNHYIELSKKFMNLTLSITDSQFRRFLKFVHELSGKINSDCMSTLISLFYGLRRQQSWALKFIDSTGFLPRGIIDGTFTSLGEYDQCISIQIPGELVKRNKEKNPDVYGKYCLTKLHLTKYNLMTAQERKKFHRQHASRFNRTNSLADTWSPDDRVDEGEEEDERTPMKEGKWRTNKAELDKFKYNGTIVQNTVFENVSRLGLDFFQHIQAFRIGICAPSTCSNSDINIFLNKILNEYKIYAQVSARCDSTLVYQSSYQSKYTVIAFFVLLFSGSMVGLGTALDFLRRLARCGVYPNENLIRKLFRCFSIRTAFFRLTKCNCEQQAELYPIHGLKVLLLVWLIWSSTYLFGVFYSVLWLYKRLIVVKEIPRQFWFQLVSNSWLISDAFFFLSGLLLVYAGSAVLSKSNGKSRFFFYIVQRILRLAPLLVGLFCFYLLMLNFIYGAVLLDDQVRRQLVFNCEQNWWRSLLFINNMDDPKSMCLPNTFYLSVNVQLTLIFYPIVMVMNQRPKIAIHLLLVIIVVAICYSGFVTYDSNLLGMILSDQLTNLDHINYHLQSTYFPTLQHLSSYAIGLLTGCFILNRQSLLKNLNKMINFLLWTLSIGLSAFAVFLPYFWNDAYPSTLDSVLYSALHRPIFVIGLALLTFLMINGNAKFFSRILCANAFIPLSRLSLATYLVHLPVVYLKFYTSKNTIVWSNLDFLFSTMTILLLSLTFGLLLYILFQSPFESIQKVIFDDSKGNHDIFNYEQNYKTTINNLTATRIIPKQCHCGLNEARLRAKVNLDFSSSFGLKSQKSQLNSMANQLNGGGSGGAVGGDNSPTEFSGGSSTKSLNADYPDCSTNFLVSNHISYNTNGEAELNALDRADKLDGLNGARLMAGGDLGSDVYLNATNPKHFTISKLSELSDYQNERDDDDVQLPPLDKTYTSYQAPDKNYRGEIDLPNTSMAARLNHPNVRSLPGFNNQIGNNVAEEIRKRLNQIKQTTSKLNSSMSQTTVYQSTRTAGGGISNIQEEENEEGFDFYSTDLNNESAYHQNMTFKV